VTLAVIGEPGKHLGAFAVDVGKREITGFHRGKYTVKTAAIKMRRNLR
jgi:hypothetical protein